MSFRGSGIEQQQMRTLPHGSNPDTMLRQRQRPDAEIVKCGCNRGTSKLIVARGMQPHTQIHDPIDVVPLRDDIVG